MFGLYARTRPILAFSCPVCHFLTDALVACQRIGYDGKVMKHRDPEAQTVSQYLRMPASQHAMVDQVAKQLGIPMSRVLNAMLGFLMQTPPQRATWAELLKFLRGTYAEEAKRHGTVMVDFDESQFETRRANYQILEKIGLIENLVFKRASEGRRVYCSFRVSEMGRVMTEIFRRSARVPDTDEELQVFGPVREVRDSTG